MSSFNTDSILSLSTLVDTDEFKKATEKFWNDASINNLYKVKDVELVIDYLLIPTAIRVFAEYKQFEYDLNHIDWDILKKFQIKIIKKFQKPKFITEFKKITITPITSSQLVLWSIKDIKKMIKQSKWCCEHDMCDESCLYSEDRRRKIGACIGCYYYDHCKIINGCTARRSSGEYIEEYKYDDDND